MYDGCGMMCGSSAKAVAEMIIAATNAANIVKARFIIVIVLMY
jgi:hypothetical protein